MFAATSISAKLRRLVFVAVGISLTIVATAGLVQELRSYAQAKRDTLLTAAQVFSTASASAVADRDTAATLRTLRAIGRVPGFEYARASAADGTLVAEIGRGVRLDGELDLSGPETVSGLIALMTTRSVSVDIPMVNGGETIGRLHLIATTQDLLARTGTVIAAALAAAAAALAAGLSIAARMQRSITRPLIDLTATMEAIQRGHDYGTTVAVSGDDEVARLAGGFNSMLGEIRDRDTRLVRHRDRLEQDVAERTRDLVTARDAAEAANGAKSEFLATMSHEIRTPMNGVLVMAELLAAGDLTDRDRRYAEVIARSGQSLLAIINDILDFAKVEAGKLDLESVAVAPGDLVDTVVTLFAEKARSKGLDLAASVAPRIPAHILGDPVRLNQIIGNLVNNAIKFTAEGHVRIEIDRTEDGRLSLAVTDTGIGIPADKIDTIFTAFSQADQSTTRKFGGTGLGLAICRKLVLAMNGEIAATSVPGQGSTFTVTLPLTDAGGDARPAPLSAGALVRTRIAGAATRMVLERALAADGFVIPGDGAGTAHAIVDADSLLAAGRRPDGSEGRLVLAMAGMGDSSGGQALERGLADMILRWPVTVAELRPALEALSCGAVPEATAKTAAAAPAARFPGLRVLVVDDSAVNREVAAEALARLGATAVTVEGGAEAIALLRHEPFDLVLMDGSMPDMDGFEAARRIRQEERAAGRPRMPIVAATAHVIGAAAEAWRGAGMDGTLHKPFSLAKLAECLGSVTGGSAPTEAVEAARTRDVAPLLSPDHLAQLEEIAGGTDGFIARVFSLYADHAPGAVDTLALAAAAGDAAETARAAHALKSMSWNCGAERVARLMGEIEDAARSHAAVPDATLIAIVRETLAATLRAVDALPGAEEQRLSA